jgi:hypothetical protein
LREEKGGPLLEAVEIINRQDALGKGGCEGQTRCPRDRSIPKKRRDRSVYPHKKGQVGIPKFGYSRGWRVARRCGWLEA